MAAVRYNGFFYIFFSNLSNIQISAYFYVDMQNLVKIGRSAAEFLRIYTF